MTERQRPQRSNLTVFVDANALLFLYEHYDPKLAELAAKLQLARDSIFITQQIVDEIERNKLRIARKTLDDALGKLIVPSDKLPFGLQRHLPDLRKANAELAKAIDAIKVSAREHLIAVSRSEDEISKTLGVLYAAAISPSEKTLKRARQRKERGIPPGKTQNPLGDQISWEQLLEHVVEKRPIILWIVTGDQDFVVPNIGKPAHLMLNPVLRTDLVRFAPSCDIRVFEKKDIADALNEYFDEQGLVEERFTEQELDYFEYLADEDEGRREPWQCKMDGQQTPIETAVCVACDEELDGAIFEEVYAIERVEDGYMINLSPDMTNEFEACSKCGGTVFDLEFESLCSHCRHITESD